MKEADIQRNLGNYFRRECPPYSIAYELKLVKGKSFAFDRLPRHQIDGLLMALSGLHHKIADTFAMNKNASKKPFDAIWIKAEQSLVILCFYQPRKLKRCYFIPVKDYISLVNNHPRKSVRMEELKFDYIDL